MEKKTIFEWMTGISNKDYDMFCSMSTAVRVKVVGSLFLTNLSILAILILGIGMTGFQSLAYGALFYFLVFLVLFLPDALYILFPRLKSIVIQLVFFLLAALLMTVTYYGIKHRELRLEDIAGKWVVLLGIFSIWFAIKFYSSAGKHIYIDKTRAETEIWLAREIQEELVPPLELKNDYFEIYGETITAAEVGGDHFDAVIMKNGKLAVAVGDVDDSNVGAGLLMAVTNTAFRMEICHHSEPDVLMESLNQMVIKNSTKKMSVAFTLGMFDFEERTLTFSEAGEAPVLHYKSGSGCVDELKSEGPALGKSVTAAFFSRCVSFDAGDMFLFFTNGLIEKCNARRERFGKKNLCQLLQNNDASDSAKVFYQKIISRLKRFSGPVPPDDDITVTVVKIKS
ncbi:MAG: serine/threonine-protein phosphatase [bacterium]|nr:serine/threonine-protein phosphatase [bacterium]